jgi:hypothetical protein
MYINLPMSFALFPQMVKADQLEFEIDESNGLNYNRGL